MNDIYQPYPYRYPGTVKALYELLRRGLISRVMFAYELRQLMGKHR